MPIPPSLVGGGLAGWLFLDRTLPRQTETFESSPDIKRNVDYVTEKLSQPLSLDDLMGDRRLLGPVLGSFGLDSEINKGALVRRIISDGPDDPNGFARRLNNSDFIALSETFQPDSDGLIRLNTAEIAELTDQYQKNAFQQAVGEQDNDLRLALNAQDKLPSLAQDSATNETVWFRILGSTPLREIVTTALGAPDGFANLDLEQQVRWLEDRSQQRYGGDAKTVFSTDEGVERMIKDFMLQRQIAAGPSALTPGATALSILGSGFSSGLGSGGLAGLLLSNA